nr:MAG TPA: hypothetical protein [Bacteriophage sp.]
MFGKTRRCDRSLACDTIKSQTTGFTREYIVKIIQVYYLDNIFLYNLFGITICEDWLK